MQKDEKLVNGFQEPGNVRKLSYLGGIKTKIYGTFLNPKVAGEIRDTLRRLSSKDRQAERNCLWIKHAFAGPITC